MIDGGVLVVGSANMDLVVQAPRIPRPGETVLGRGFHTFPGGKGANQAVAVGRLGGRVVFLGRVGSDQFGTDLEGSLTEAGVDTSALKRDPEAPTGVALIQVEDSGQNSIAIVPGANGRLTPKDVADGAAGSSAAFVLVQLEVPDDAVLATLALGSATRRVILNPAPARRLASGALEGVAIVTPNESEAEILTGVLPSDDASCRVAARALLDEGVDAVIITLGASGCFYADAKSERHYDAMAVKPVDTTAAGDAFNGALAHFLACGRSIDNAIGLATCVAGLSTTKFGAQTSMPCMEELRAVAAKLL